MFVIGIDPGATGAVAILNKDGGLVDVFDMPSLDMLIGGKNKRRVVPELLAAELRFYDKPGTVGVVEQVSARPGQGVASMFAFGQAYGQVLGVLAGMSIPTTTVTSAVWKRDLKMTSFKDAARLKAAQTWPLAAKQFARNKDDGRAEASLIALWFQKHNPKS